MGGIKPKSIKAPPLPKAEPPPPIPAPLPIPDETPEAAEFAMRQAMRRRGRNKTVITGALEPEYTGKKTTLG